LKLYFQMKTFQWTVDKMSSNNIQENRDVSQFSLNWNKSINFDTGVLKTNSFTPEDRNKIECIDWTHN
jgi:hypothetical protein